jgi:hypothetical protein
MTAPIPILLTVSLAAAATDQKTDAEHQTQARDKIREVT